MNSSLFDGVSLVTDDVLTVATPYGVLITPTVRDVDGHPEPTMSAEDIATLIGLHAGDKRRAFISELHAVKPNDEMVPVVEKFGGGKAARVPLPVPASPLYSSTEGVVDPDRADGLSMKGVVDSWVEALTDEPRWHERATVLLGLLGRQIEQYSSWNNRQAAGANLSGIVTVALERLEETEVGCLEAAAFYALTTHDRWRAAGKEWLLPHRKTWVKDWIKVRPVYRRLARLTDMAYRDVPSWLREVV